MSQFLIILHVNIMDMVNVRCLINHARAMKFYATDVSIGQGGFYRQYFNEIASVSI